MTSLRPITRRPVVLAGATLTAAAVIAGGAAFTSSASADAVTSGSTTFAVPTNTVLSGASAGIVAIPTKPATVTYDQASNAADYVFPVSGGDGSIAADYGSVNHNGGLLVSDYKTRKAVTLTSLSYSVTDNTVSVVPQGSTTSIVLADINGSHEFYRNAATGEQTYNGSDVQLDPAGAAYLNKALATTVFKAGAHLGTFATDFVNSQY